MITAVLLDAKLVGSRFGTIEIHLSSQAYEEQIATNKLNHVALLTFSWTNICVSFDMQKDAKAADVCRLDRRSSILLCWLL